MSNKYEIFIKAVEHGNFTKAAEELFLTQSGVSHAIQSLEDELGLSLLVRNRGGVTLTADGKAVLPKIKEIVEKENKLLEYSNELKNLDTGIVRVAVFTSVSVTLMPGLLMEFKKNYPNIQFDLIFASYNSEMEECILNGEADCGFIRLTPNIDMDTIPLMTDDWKVITSINHPYKDYKIFPINGLRNEDFVLREEGDDYETGAIFDKLQLKPNIKYRVREDQAALAMVSEGLGISLMPKLMLLNCPYKVASLDLPEKFERELGIVVKDKNTISQSTRKFIAFTRSWVKEKCGDHI